MVCFLIRFSQCCLKRIKFCNLFNSLGKYDLYSFSFFLFLSFCHFFGHSRGIWRLPGEGSTRSCSRRPTPEPQQRGIRAASATYTTAHGNAGSLTHWARAGTEPATSWFLVRFFNHCTTTGTPQNIFFWGGGFPCMSPLAFSVEICRLYNGSVRGSDKRGELEGDWTGHERFHTFCQSQRVWWLKSLD